MKPKKDPKTKGQSAGNINQAKMKKISRNFQKTTKSLLGRGGGEKWKQGSG